MLSPMGAYFKTQAMASEEVRRRKLEELQVQLERLGHVPQQKEDRALYASVKYYYTNYPDHPLVRKLVERFPRPAVSGGEADLEGRLRKMEEKLLQYGKVPTADEDAALWNQVNDCYKKYATLPSVRRLAMLYPTSAMYSKWGRTVPEGTVGSMVVATTGKIIGDVKIGGYRNVESPYIRAERYIRQCMAVYNELPGRNTWPMHFAFERMNGSYRKAVSRSMLDLAREIMDRGLASPDLMSRYYGSALDEPFLSDRIAEVLNKYKVVTLGYLSKHLVNGIIIDTEALYRYFYYQEQNKGYPSLGIRSENRHKYRLMRESGSYASLVVSVGIEELARLDFKEVASDISLAVLPTYTAEMGDEAELEYARSFLFHHEKEWTPTGRILHVDTGKTLFDDLAGGICPFRFLDTYPFPDACEKSVDWCFLLVKLQSRLLDSYIRQGLFFPSFSRMIKEHVLAAAYQSKIERIRRYMMETYQCTL